MSTPSSEQRCFAQWRVMWKSNDGYAPPNVGFDTRAAAEAFIAESTAKGGPEALALYRLEREWVQQPNYVERVPHPDAP